MNRPQLIAGITCLFAIPFALFAFDGQATLTYLQGKQIRLVRDEAELAAAVRQQIPIGSTLETAERILSLNQFRCEWRRANGFPGGETAPKQTANFMSCYRQTSQIVCATTYKPVIHFQRNRVTRIDASIGQFCL